MSRKTTDNPTLAAMIAIDQQLGELTDAGKAQVLRWVNDEYGHVLADPVEREMLPRQLDGHVVDDAEVFPR